MTHGGFKLEVIIMKFEDWRFVYASFVPYFSHEISSAEALIGK